MDVARHYAPMIKVVIIIFCHLSSFNLLSNERIIWVVEYYFKNKIQNGNKKFRTPKKIGRRFKLIFFMQMSMALAVMLDRSVRVWGESPQCTGGGQLVMAATLAARARPGSGAVRPRRWKVPCREYEWTVRGSPWPVTHIWRYYLFVLFSESVSQIPNILLLKLCTNSHFVSREY